MRKFGIILLMSLLFSLGAESHNRDRGSNTGTFLKLPIGAKQISLGQTGVSHGEGSKALYWNPALLGYKRIQELSFTRTEFILDTSHSFLAYGSPVGSHSIGWGFSANYFESDSITQVDDTGLTVGNIRPQDTAFSIGMGFPVGFLRFGWVGKYIYSEIINSASATSADVGASMEFLNGKGGLGITGQNLIDELTFDQVKEKLPRIYKVGFHVLPFSHSLISTDIQLFNDRNPTFGLGYEYAQKLSSAITGALRVGYNSDLAEDKDEFSGGTFGLGLIVGRGLHIDYSFVPMGELGSTHYLTMAIRFLKKNSTQKGREE